MRSTTTMVTVRRDNDPFKKYWWVLLVGFGLTGLWVLIPLMGQTGSSHVAVTKPASIEDQNLQSLDAQTNPSGAQGSAIDLSMDGSLRKKSRGDEAVTSSLYQPLEGGAPGAPIVEAAKKDASVNLAAALKAVSKSDPAGWGGAKAQKGFTAPKASFRGLSGVGGASSGGSGASISASPFNSPTAQVSVQDGAASGSEAGSVSGGKAFMRSVRNVQAQSLAASKLSSTDGSRAGSATSFDGSQAGGKTIGSGGKSIVFGQFDHGMAPVNLKRSGVGGLPDGAEDDPLDKIAEALENAKGTEVKDDYQEQMGDQMGQMVMAMVVGGLMEGVVGPTAAGVLTTYMMQSTQMLKQNNVNK
ncbi:MAG: hypothetical protein HY924_05090 [Elusimicrobia bacterium]|nr:hypothetical protein [Elusimicrobiota bacterium]